MSLKGDLTRYGALAASLHWLSALAILSTILLGFTAAHARDPAHAAVLLRLHLPLGVLILGLTLARAVWWLVDVRPGALPGQPGWQDRLARTNHVLLYIVIFLLCASGIGLVALSHAAPTIFSRPVTVLPDFASLPPMAVHAASAFVLVGLLALHLGAVAYHQFWRYDRLLARMHVGHPRAAA